MGIRLLAAMREGGGDTSIQLVFPCEPTLVSGKQRATIGLQLLPT